MSINGFLTLGTALSGMVVVPPPSGTGYVPQPISFDLVPGGVTLNDISCVFGPVSGSWGTLSVFGVTDQADNPYWSGTLSAPYAPVNGQLVIVPQGNIALVVGAQIFATPAAAPVPPSPSTGVTVSGTVGLSSGAYVLALAAGPRSTLLLTNTGTGSVNVILGGSLPPVSGAEGFSIVPPFGSWPPPGFAGFTPTDNIWALSSVDGVQLSTLVGYSGTPPSARNAPPIGTTSSGSVVMSSGAYVPVLGAGPRAAVLLTNTSSGGINIILGGASPPASGAAGFTLIPPFGTWPPPGLFDFVPTDPIWALSALGGVALNTLVGYQTGRASATSGPTTSGAVVLSSGAYAPVLSGGSRDFVLLTNPSSGSVNIMLGGTSAPASGTTGFTIVPPFGTWPPPGMGNFIPIDPIWALSSIDGVILNTVTG